MPTRSSPRQKGDQTQTSFLKGWFVTSAGHLLRKAGEKKFVDQGQIVGCSFILKNSNAPDGNAAAAQDRYLLELTAGKCLQLNAEDLKGSQTWTGDAEPSVAFYEASKKMPKLDVRNVAVEGFFISSSFFFRVLTSTFLVCVTHCVAQ